MYVQLYIAINSISTYEILKIDCGHVELTSSATTSSLRLAPNPLKKTQSGSSARLGIEGVCTEAALEVRVMKS